ncbi:MAG: ABC transporter permease [Oscillospiraceae bacterium]|nr:ABC transporter permease [Oscillospiraceae bacterium]
MKLMFYPKLAWTGMRSNRKLYLPYLITCISMVAMLYIVGYLSGAQAVRRLPGGQFIQEMLGLGVLIIALFAGLFLLYSSSFLMRRRKKEFGLYNILGMGKRHLSMVVFWETVMTAVISIFAGLFAGVTLSKLAELCIVNIVGGDVDYSLTVSGSSAFAASVVFAVIFLAIMVKSLWQIGRTNAINLIKSENVGEKLPRMYWFWGILGAVILGAAYYLALSIEDPLSALLLFFAAVGMVILATYLLFMSGSVLLCKLLQKNKRYYYKPNHFVSVSSMAYRMTRNGAGLASICILLTMVLVMLSSTSCLFFGVEESLHMRYPREITVDAYVTNPENGDFEDFAPVRDYIDSILDDYNAARENVMDYRVASLSGQLFGSELELDPNNMKVSSANVYGDVRIVNFVPLEDYNRMSGADFTLEPDEILLFAFRTPYEEENLVLRGTGLSFRVKEHLSEFPIDGDTTSNVMSSLYVVVPDFYETLKPLYEMRASNGNDLLNIHWQYGFDTNVDEGTQKVIYEALGHDGNDEGKAFLNNLSYIHYDSRAYERDSFTGTFSGLFVLGLVLSVVFLFAAVLIIYYKQITEGYEDQKRFEVMQKVGMTKRDIRQSINSQMLTVFFLPLVMAGIHLCFAFPMIRLLLRLFNMTNVPLFALTTGTCFALFGLLYLVVYKLTSNAYFSIVSGDKED